MTKSGMGSDRTDEKHAMQTGNNYEYTSVLKTPSRSAPLRSSGTQTIPEPKEVQTDYLVPRSPMQYNEEYESHATMNIADKRLTYQRPTQKNLPPRPRPEEVNRSLNTTASTSIHIDGSIASDFQDYRASNERLDYRDGRQNEASDMKNSTMNTGHAFYNHDYEDAASSLPKNQKKYFGDVTNTSSSKLAMVPESNE